MEGGQQFVFPQGYLLPSEVVRHAHQRVVLDLCYDFSNQPRPTQKTIVSSVDPIFYQYKEISSSYMDDHMNTDNAWLEVAAASAHDNKNTLSSEFKKGPGVEEVIWYTVTDRPDLNSNMSSLLRKTLILLKSYNPYKTTEEGQESETQ